MQWVRPLHCQHHKTRWDDFNDSRGKKIFLMTKVVLPVRDPVLISEQLCRPPNPPFSLT